MTKEKHHKGLKFITVSILVIFALFSILFAYLYQHKDAIIGKLISDLDQKIEGEISYSEIDLAPFHSLPNISFTISDLSIQNYDSLHIDTLLKMKQLIISIDLIQVLQSNIDLKQLTLSEGFINVFQMSNGTYAIIDAIKLKNSSPDSLNTEEQISLDIEKLLVENVQIQYRRLKENAFCYTSIKKVNADISYIGDSLSTEFQLDALIHQFELDKKELLKEDNFSINGGFNYSRKSAELLLKSLKLKILEANFLVGGMIHLSGEQKIKLHFDVDDEDLKFTKLFLASSKEDLIRSGNLYLKGDVSGSMHDEIPRISAVFGSKDLNLNIPEIDDQITDLYIKGSFISGRKSDLSEAMVQVDSISATLPEGSVNGHFKVKDLHRPYLDYQVDLKTRIDAFDKVIKMTAFDSLSGMIDLKANYLGYVEKFDSILNEEHNKFTLKLTDVSFTLSDDFRFEQINGQINGKDDELKIDTASLVLNHSNIHLSGPLHHYFSLFFDLEKPAVADLQITTALFDYPVFFEYSSNIALSFPYKINDVDLKVEVTTSKSKLSQFNNLPWINFNIHELTCNIADLCPPIKLKGNFLVAEDQNVGQLDFSQFSLKLGSNPISLNLFYAFAKSVDDSLSITAHLDTFNVGKNVYFDFLSSLRDSSKLIIDGDVHTEVLWFKNNENGYKKIAFSSDSLKYKKGKFSLNTTKSNFLAEDIKNINDGSFPFSNLSGNIQLDFEKIYSTYYEDKNIHFDITIDKGQFMLDAKYSSEPFQNLMINLNARPFDSIPSYSVKHSAKNQDIKNIFPQKVDESLHFGRTDMEIDLSFQGRTKKDLLQSLNGTVLLKGDSMLLMGYDIDNLIKKFERSQNFNLVDLGAVIIAGPVGILYTKGSDYAMMLVDNKKDSSIINEFYSLWAIEDGFFVVKDFAFATDENRIAIEGWVNMNADSLDLTIALIDSLGCSIISQDLKGNIEDPKSGKPKVVKTALAPVTNIVDKVLKVHCDVFYNGVVKPPLKMKKNKK